jgi:biotin carboxylase
LKAVALASELRFPVFVKKSFSWAGQGTILCQNTSEVKQAYEDLNPKRTLLKNIVRRVLCRDWYPANSAIEVQSAQTGVSVMFNVVAWRGHYLGGFFASREQTVGGNGPSTIVSIGPNPVCEAIARKLVAAMGASGFLAFDFIWDQSSNSAVLLECNPRPNQISHLGPHIGVDLCRALKRASAGECIEVSPVTNSVVVPLFPQEWLRDEDSALKKLPKLDIPRQDPSLLEFMLDEGQKKGRSVERLNLALA